MTRLENNKYQLLMNNHKEVFHINSLRKYYTNEEDASASVNMMVIEDVDGNELLDSAPDGQTSGKPDTIDSINIINLILHND